MVKIVLCSLLVMSCSWSMQDKALLASYGALSAIDAVQTLSCTHCRELNPILATDGKPDAVKIIGVKTASLIGVYFMADYFKDYRTTVLIVPVAMQSGVVIWNMQY